MGYTVAQKVIKEHLLEGEMKPGEEIAIKIDQTLTQDATGTMAYLQFEALGIPRVRTELSVSYIDHNTLQTDFRNADDHKYLQSIARRYGIILSKAGNGICHQLHLERFAAPGKTLLGSDSHTPTAGGMGAIAIGAGGLDVAVAMGGAPFYMKMPKIMGIELTGSLPEWVSAKDVILEVLRRIGVKGGLGYILEYFGEGVKTLSVPERATITNMGAETGATTSIFPSDEVTERFLKLQGREVVFKEIKADEDAVYDKVLHIDLSELEPLVALPHSPGKVVPVREVEGLKVDQVAIGSCTNSSYMDLRVVAEILKGRKIHEDVYVSLSPGSRQVMQAITEAGYLKNIIRSGVRILEAACGPCIGMGFAPPTGGVSVRTFNRNFEGRSGTKDAKVYLVSPQTAAATAVNGVLTDPRKLGKAPKVGLPEKLPIMDDLFVYPPEKGGEMVEIYRGPNIKPLEVRGPLPEMLEGEVLLKVGDNITTDHIMPAGAKILPLRSNIPAISEHVFEIIDPTFPKRAKEKGGGFVVGGENYGQGSSREHAAIAPMHLGVKAVLAKSFARIHRANLINFGILPIIFAEPSAYDRVDQGHLLRISTSELGDEIEVKNLTTGETIKGLLDLSSREREIIKAGGKLPYTKRMIEEGRY